MAKSVNGNAGDVYVRQRESFLAELEQFHRIRGTPFQRLPCILGKPVDLYSLYNRVTALGGWQKVHQTSKWREIQRHYRIPKSCANSAIALKYIYVRYLHIYERLHFHGDDVDAKQEDDESETPSVFRSRRPCLLSDIPQVYHHRMHEVDASVRTMNNLAPTWSRSAYYKLELSLLSGLPNEVDFAINICALLSNDSRHSLRLEKCPNIPRLLLAHIGVYATDDEGALNALHELNWSNLSQHDFAKFWRDSVSNSDILSLLQNEEPLLKLSSSTSCQETRSYGSKDGELQRVIQIAGIIRNLSFEPTNATVLMAESTVLRFLLLSVSAKQSQIRQLAFDTFTNVGSLICLNAHSSKTRMLLRIVATCISSVDRAQIIGGLELLAALCQHDENDDVLNELLDTDVYTHLARLVLVTDIHLLIVTLEALLQLSELGHATATFVANVQNLVDILCNLVTMEAQALGSNAIINLRVVEQQIPISESTVISPTTSTTRVNTTSILSSSNNAIVLQKVVATPTTSITTTPLNIAIRNKIAQNTTSTSSNSVTPVRTNINIGPSINSSVINTTNTTTPLSTSMQPPQMDGEILAKNWLEANYEYTGDDHSDIAHAELYQNYLTGAHANKIRNHVTSNVFITCVRLSFPNLVLRSVDKKNGHRDIQYVGIQKRLKSLPFPPQLERAVCASPPLHPNNNTTTNGYSSKAKDLLMKKLKGDNISNFNGIRKHLVFNGDHETFKQNGIAQVDGQNDSDNEKKPPIDILSEAASVIFNENPPSSVTSTNSTKVSTQSTPVTFVFVTPDQTNNASATQTFRIQMPSNSGNIIGNPQLVSFAGNVLPIVQNANGNPGATVILQQQPVSSSVVFKQQTPIMTTSTKRPASCMNSTVTNGNQSTNILQPPEKKMFQSNSATIPVDHRCEWINCGLVFDIGKDLVNHVLRKHCSSLKPGYCKWNGICDNLIRQKWSLLQHIQEKHLSENGLRLSQSRRVNAADKIQTPSVYPENAAYHAINRFAPKPPYPELMEIKEGPVTKHIRLTAALILSNLARYSSDARSILRKHETRLAYVSLSAVESSSVVAKCLHQLVRHDMSEEPIDELS